MHNSLLEILGRGLAVDTAELLTGWLNDYGYTLGNPDDAQYRAWLQGAVDDLIQGRLDAAERQVQSRLATHPQCLAGHLALAAAYLYQEQVRKAAGHLEFVCSHRPDHTLALYAYGHCAERLGDESRAVAAYQDCLKFRGHLHLPLLRLAAIHAKNRQYEAAIEHYVSLQRLDPEAMSVHVTLGHLYVATGQYKQAIQAFQDALLMHPDALASQDPQIGGLILENHLEEALQALESQLEQGSQGAEILAQHADVLSLMGASDQAIAQYQEVLRQCPGHLAAMVKMATQYSLVEAFPEAAKSFNQAMDINEQIIEAYVGLATSYHLNGDTHNVMASLCSASMLSPNSSLLLVQTAKMLLKSMDPCLESLDDPQAAASLLQRAFRDRLGPAPRDPMACYAAGLLASYTEGPQASVQHLQQALSLQPTFRRVR